MEPITTAAAAVVGYLAKQLSEQQSVKDFLNDFSQATIDWIRPLFLKEDDTPVEMVQQLQAQPTNTDYQQLLQEMLLTDVRTQPAHTPYLMGMQQEVQALQSGITINNNAKIGQQNINSTVDNKGANFNF
ncbi:MAG: hypothetical protein AAGI23_07055 [Bacteroidota bacterium]